MIRFGKELKKRPQAFVSTRRFKATLTEYEEAIEREVENGERLHGELADAESSIMDLLRLHSEIAKYDEDAVAGLSRDAARNLAELAEKALETGGKVSFAAACAVSLKRQLDDCGKITLSPDGVRLGNWFIATDPRFLVRNCTFTNTRCANVSTPKPNA